MRSWYRLAMAAADHPMSAMTVGAGISGDQQDGRGHSELLREPPRVAVKADLALCRSFALLAERGRISAV
jgi:hypothetical protein